MNTTNKKSINRKKLLKANFEWTDDAIQAFSENSTSESKTNSNMPMQNEKSMESSSASPKSNSGGTVSSYIISNEPIKDTMEDKIARVNMRKKEAELRISKRAMLPPPPPPINFELGKYQKQQISSKFNNYNVLK